MAPVSFASISFLHYFSKIENQVQLKSESDILISILIFDYMSQVGGSHIVTSTEESARWLRFQTFSILLLPIDTEFRYQLIPTVTKERLLKRK